MLSEGMKEIGERIETRATLHRLWREPDREAALARIAPNIRAIAATWHAPKIDASLMSRAAPAGNRLQLRRRLRSRRRRLGRPSTASSSPTRRGVLDAETADTAMALTLDGGAAVSASRALSARGPLAEARRSR